MFLSICIPCYNSEKNIKQLVDSIFFNLKEYRVQVILVNDASKDGTDIECQKIAQTNKSVKYISLRKNFGEHNAVMCGLNFVKGDYVIIIDDDFQNPPEEILKLINKMELGVDLIYTKYDEKKHHFLRNVASKFNNFVATLVLGKPKDLYLSSFKAIKKEVVEEVIKYKGPFPYIDGLLLSVTSNISVETVRHQERTSGKSNYTIGKLFSLWLNMFINFTIRPLRIFTIFGILITLISFIFAIILIIQRILNPNIAPGWSSIIVAVTFFSGVQTIFVGLLSEYIGKNYLTSSNSPQWSIKKIIN